MCGIAGFWQPPGAGAPRLRALARAMAGALESRGPDDEGSWCHEKSGLALGHRRLSILDLSPEGRQPMVSRCGGFVLAYNGEVYNFAELRAELMAEGATFRGTSDTEVALEAMARWGIERALDRFHGMFAFALFDRRQGRLFLVRDRLGIKPLYWGLSNGTLLFGSELKSVLAHPSFEGSIDRDALALLLRHNYIVEPHCIYRGFRKLPPGHLAVFRGPREPLVRCWWDARDVARSGRTRRVRGDVTERLDALLKDAVALRTVADVPVGAFLSGGIDSSLVVALMSSLGGSVKTYSIGFLEAGYDEAKHAAKVAAHLGTRHTELYVRPEDAMGVIPELPRIWDEPFSDSSQIPTYLVSKLARTGVTVSLSGDGGDELFGGYGRYRTGARLARLAAWAPPPLRGAVARLLGRIPNGTGRLGDRLRKLAEILSTRDAQALYHGLVSHWKRPAEIVLGATEPETAFHDATLKHDLPGLLERMTYLDSVTYLPGDILTKVDRASMAVGLEARVPLLDHRVFEFAWRLPPAKRAGKAPLKAVLARYVPRALFDRPKRGFGLPVGPWLRGPLRDWAEDLLDPRRLRSDGFFRPEPILRAWREHLSGERRWHYYLWDVLAFQAWLSLHEAPRATAVAV